jgi:hypothetical protein
MRLLPPAAPLPPRPLKTDPPPPPLPRLPTLLAPIEWRDGERTPPRTSSSSSSADARSRFPHDRRCLSRSRERSSARASWCSPTAPPRTAPDAVSTERAPTLPPPTLPKLRLGPLEEAAAVPPMLEPRLRGDADAEPSEGLLRQAGRPLAAPKGGALPLPPLLLKLFAVPALLLLLPPNCRCCCCVRLAAAASGDSWGSGAFHPASRAACRAAAAASRADAAAAADARTDLRRCAAAAAAEDATLSRCHRDTGRAPGRAGNSSGALREPARVFLDAEVEEDAR